MSSVVRIVVRIAVRTVALVCVLRVRSVGCLICVSHWNFLIGLSGLKFALHNLRYSQIYLKQILMIEFRIEIRKTIFFLPSQSKMFFNFIVISRACHYTKCSVSAHRSRQLARYFVISIDYFVELFLSL
jgi:hypothetical protein